MIGFYDKMLMNLKNKPSLSDKEGLWAIVRIHQPRFSDGRPSQKTVT